MIHSRLVYQFCCRNNFQPAIKLLSSFVDIDIMYDDGGIIDLAITKEQPVLLSNLLQYFEEVQYPFKNNAYHIAHQELVEKLEELGEGSSSKSEVNTIISQYIGSDIATLVDVVDNNAQSDEDHVAACHSTNKLSSILLNSLQSGISDPIDVNSFLIGLPSNIDEDMNPVVSIMD